MRPRARFVFKYILSVISRNKNCDNGNTAKSRELLTVCQLICDHLGCLLDGQETNEKPRKLYDY